MVNTQGRNPINIPVLRRLDMGSNIFMCGEWEHAGNLPAYFACLHRQSKCACSAGHCDLFAGAAALAADVNGLGMKVPHVRNKITGMIMAFTINAAGSPATNQVAVRRAYNLEKRIQYARELSGIRNCRKNPVLPAAG